MKTMKKILLTALIILLSATTMFAQIYEWKEPPKSFEKELGTVSDHLWAGSVEFLKNGAVYANTNKSSADYRSNHRDEELYSRLLDMAREKYDRDDVELRSFKSIVEESKSIDDETRTVYSKYYKFSAIAVIPNAMPQNVEGDPLSGVLDKALMDIREGSRIAIDQVRVLSGMDKNEYKDQIVEILIDKGYKVVAKEYLEKLYDEQQAQQSGIYNSKTTVKENNFSAVGYYLNVRLTETSLRVQVINVSTGEYDANVTIKL